MRNRVPGLRRLKAVLMFVTTGLLADVFPVRLWGISFFRLIFLISVCMALFPKPLKGLRLTVPRNPMIYGIIVWSILAASAHPTREYLSYVLSQVLMFFLAIFFLSTARLAAASELRYCSLIAGGIACLADWVFYLVPSLSGRLGLRSSDVWIAGARMPRLVGVNNDPNFTAVSVVLVAVVSLSMFLKNEHRTLSLVVFFTSCGTVAATFSRSGIAAVTVGLSIVGVSPTSRSGGRGPFGRLRQVSQTCLLLACAVFAVYWTGLFTWVVSRFSSVSLGRDVRLDLWTEGMSVLSNHLLVGTGTGLVTFMGQPLEVHNTWLDAGLLMGLPGLALYSGMWLWSLGKAFCLPREEKGWIIALLVGTMVGLTFLSAIGWNFGWFVVSLPEAVRAGVKLRNQDWGTTQ